MHYKDTIMGITLDFIKKHRYVGSGNGCRYIIEKNGDEEIQVWLWPDVVCFEETEAEKKEDLHFPLTNEGFMEALEAIYQRVKEN